MARGTERVIGSDFPNGIARDECRRAALEVMKIWPDETIAPKDMRVRASAFLRADGYDGKMARHLLSDFISQCRNYPTIERSERFWAIMHGLFARQEALKLYLGQCRGLMAGGQRQAISRHLREQGYTRKEISAAQKKLNCQREV